MNTRSALFVVILAIAVSVPAQTYNPERKYAAGMSDAYTMKMTMNSSMGELGVRMDMTQIVKKVYDNGDADIETTTENLTVNMAGKEIRPVTPPPTTSRLNKYGLLVSASANKGMNFSRFGSYFGEKELKVGETYMFEQADKDNPKAHVKGTAKLLSVENGKATIAVAIDSFAANVEKPMHMEGTVVSDAATGKMLRFEAKATDLIGMGGPGMTVASAQFTIEHK